MYIKKSTFSKYIGNQKKPKVAVAASLEDVKIVSLQPGGEAYQKRVKRIMNKLMIKRDASFKREQCRITETNSESSGQKSDKPRKRGALKLLPDDLHSLSVKGETKIKR